MLTALSTMFWQYLSIGPRYGFAGIQGLFGILIGLIIMVVIVAILFKILKLALPALGIADPWASIIYWLAVLVTFLAFCHFFGFY